MPMDSGQMEMLGAQMVLLGDAVALLALQAEAAADNDKAPAFLRNLKPEQLEWMESWLALFGDWLALMALLEATRSDK